MTASSTLENNSEAAALEHSHDHAAEPHDHAHGPVLNPECSRELVIDVPAEEVSRVWTKVAAKYRKHAKIPGFRPGKVPESVIRSRFNAEIRKEVIDTLLPERFNKGVAELGIQPVGQPQVTELTIEDGAPLHVKAVFEFVPPFSIEGYKDVTVPRPPVEVTEEEFQQEIERLRLAHATIEPVEEDRALAEGDLAQIGYKGEIQKETTEADGADAEEPVRGEETLVEVGGKDTLEPFTEALRGAKPGQELKLEVVYPENYAEPKLAGKRVAYEITVKAIKRRILPELNDDFAKETGQYDSYADLEKGLRESLAARKRRSVESETKDRLFAALHEKFAFPTPESLVQDMIDIRLERGLRALAAQGMSAEMMRQLDFPRLRAAQRESALAEVKTTILLDRIADEEKITVSQEEMDRELQIAALQSGETFDALKDRLAQEDGLLRIAAQVRREKTSSILYERLPA